MRPVTKQTTAEIPITQATPHAWAARPVQRAPSGTEPENTIIQMPMIRPRSRSGTANWITIIEEE